MTCFGGNKTDKNETWQLENVYEHKWRRKGVPLAICPYLDHYFLASAGKKVNCINCAFFQSI
jgi:splicing factor 3B subunit 3